MKASETRCLYCSRPRGCGGNRGLCSKCYSNKRIRGLFPAKRTKLCEAETAEEVEALVAAQMQCRPAWWDRETSKERQREAAR